MNVLKTLAVLVVAAFAQPIAVSAQTGEPPAKAPKSWIVPRTPWGDPDIQGLWPSNVVAHPFETFDDLGPYDRCITRGCAVVDDAHGL